MELLVTALSLFFGFVAFTRRNAKISRQIWYLERQTMTRFESFFRSMIYAILIYALSFILISFALNTIGIEL